MYVGVAVVGQLNDVLVKTVAYSIYGLSLDFSLPTLAIHGCFVTDEK